MTTQSSDTSPEAEAVQFRIWAEMPGWRKLELVGEMNRMVRELMLAGLRERYPNASEEEIKRRLMDLTLGPELAERVYGPLPKDV